jgi:cell wall-associated NlpC family hydrolase
LTGAAYQQLGVQLGPTTRQQISDGIGVDFTPSQWQPSDLLLFCGDGVTPSHVALWIGDGSGQIVHAANCEYGVYISGMVTSQPLCGVRRIIGG